MEKIVLNGYTGLVNYYDLKRNAWEEGVEELQKNGFSVVKRPHRKLPALVRYWARLLNRSEEGTIWLRRKADDGYVVWALAGCHSVTVGNGFESRMENHYVVNIFGRYEIEQYEESCNQ